MAESTLSIQWSELETEVAVFQGWDRTSSNWSSDETSDFADIVKKGLRKFYYPPSIEGKPRHEWSFLRPQVTMALSNADFDYDLPDDFSGVIIDESITFGDGDAKRRVRKVSEEHLRALQSKDQQTGTPLYYALRTKAHAPTTGLRYELLFYPTPDGAMTIRYRYVVAPDTIDSTNKYPYGGAMHSETILEAVLSAAEERMDDDAGGVHHMRFMACLEHSVRTDSEHKGAVASGSN